MRSNTTDVGLPVLTFQLGEQTYALPIAQVVEVAAMVQLTNLLHTRPEVLGAASRHGEVLPMLDLGQVMGTGSIAFDEETLFIVVQRSGQGSAGAMCGLVVELVQQVQYLAPQHITQNGVSQYIHGITTHHTNLIQILDMNTIMDTYLARANTVEGE